MRNRRPKLNNSNSGVALVTVLVITAVTLALGYAALTISLSVLQGSKAAESSVQARLNAESGLDAIFVFLSDQFHQGVSLDEIEFSIPRVLLGTGMVLQEPLDYSFSSSESPILSGDNVLLSIDGLTTNDTTYTVSASLLYNPGSTAELDPDATPENPSTIQDILYRGLTSCSSSDFHNATFVQSDVWSVGDLNLKNGMALHGNIIVNSNTELDSSVAVHENAYINGNLTLKNGAVIYGSAFVRGNLALHSSAKIYGQVYVTGDVTPQNTPGVYKIQEGGNSYENEIFNEAMMRFETFTLSESACSSSPSQKTAIEGDIEKLLQNRPPAPPSYEVNKGVWNISPGLFNDEVVTTKLGEFAGQNIRFMYLDNFNVTGKSVHISGGDVVILVRNETKLNGPNLKIDPDSSLTIITPSQIEVSGGPTTWSTVNDNNIPSLSFYTSYRSSNKSGYHQTNRSGRIHAVVYSPYSNVTFDNSAQLTGAIVAGKIIVKNSGFIIHNPRLFDLIGGATIPGGGQSSDGLEVIQRR